jgi:hypothetical protein
MNASNRLERLFLAGFSNLLLCLRARPGAYPRVEHLKGAFLAYAPALLGKIRLGCIETNTLAYLAHS